jgi:D-alanine transaminase
MSNSDWERLDSGMSSDLPASLDGNSIVHLNGELIPLKQARVSVLDRGFIFGDGVYEVIPVYARQPFRLDEHIRRLQSSLNAIGLANPHDAARWGALIREVIERSPHADQSVYLQVTRGIAKRDHAFPSEVRPTVFVMASSLSTPTPDQIARGVPAVTAPDNRWLRCDIKSTALLPNVLLRQYAVERGAAEVVLLRDGQLTEGSASNIFVVRDGTLGSPPKSHLILPGITYDVVLELARSAGIPVELRAITEAEVRSADELWLTSSIREVLAITTLDGRAVAEGVPGPLFRRVHALFQELKSKAAHPALARHA